MSGIVGIVNWDGAPVDRELLSRMTASLARRGPDAQEVWLNGEVAFGHALLRTTWESGLEQQPLTLEGDVWITADARIDERENLIQELRSADRYPSKHATDPELVLHAYHAWDEKCVEHLLGDFSFGLWDARTGRLFCARDHLGIKPLYYFQGEGNFTFSNTLRCLRLSPAVSCKLNDAAITDFLLFGSNQNPATTSFTDIQRLPPGHFLVLSEQQFRIVQFWRLPIEQPIHYKRPDDYIEHFRHLLRTAVQDRLRTDRAGVFMSGGLDSTALAATAQEVLSATGSASYDLRAYTVIYDWLIPDDEGHYARLVADALSIPIHFLAADNYGFYQRWNQQEFGPSEPVHNPLGLAVYHDLFAEISGHSRVMLYGEGPDNAMQYEWEPYVRYLGKRLLWRRLLREFWWHARFHRRIPVIGGLPNRVRRLRGRENIKPTPSWIRAEVADLKRNGAPKVKQVHPFHPTAYSSFTGTAFSDLFEGFDPDTFSIPVEVRYPYMDIRLLRFLMAIPPVPWGRDKFLIRKTFGNVLPAAVLRRPKTPLWRDPLEEHARISGLPQWTPHPSILRYVDPEIVASSLRNDSNGLWENLRPLSLNFFLALTESGVG